MKNLKNVVLLILLLTLFSAAKDAAAQTGRKKTSRKAKKSQTTKVKIMPEVNNANNVKVLTSGSYSKVETPFVLVARDAETYALIRGLVEDLPPSSTLDFNQTAVVAAFAGEKNTGGYSVAIRSNDKRVTIELDKPQQGGMTTQVITTPFQVAAIPLGDSQNLNLEIPMEWTNQIKSYRVTKGEFESSGGIAGRIKKFGAAGTIGVLSHNDLVTYIFNLSGTKTESARKLSSIASGVLKEGTVEITKMEAGNLVEMPHPPLKALGKVEGNKISLTFESFPPTVADGFTTRGKIEVMRNK